MSTADTSNLSESLEDYIEAIYHLVGEKQVARAKDISARPGVFLFAGSSLPEIRCDDDCHYCASSRD